MFVPYKREKVQTFTERLTVDSERADETSLKVKGQWKYLYKKGMHSTRHASPFCYRLTISISQHKTGFPKVVGAGTACGSNTKIKRVCSRGELRYRNISEERNVYAARRIGYPWHKTCGCECLEACWGQDIDVNRVYCWCVNPKVYIHRA